MKRHLAILILIPLLLESIAPRPVEAAPRCFADVPGINNCINGQIRNFWERYGGLAVFGYPLGPETVVHIDGRALIVQRFERVQLEIHPENKAPYHILLSRSGVEALNRTGRDWTSFPKAPPDAPHYFAHTGHAIAPEFWPYWSSHGLEFDGRPGLSSTESLALFGLPLSEATLETHSNGTTLLTQWFERARFELHPNNPPASRVLLGMLEREASEGLAGNPGLSTPAYMPAPGFVGVDGDKLVLSGQSIQIKGVNYYPQGRPWAEMWKQWDGLQVQRELHQARDDLGINAVRVLLPYQLDDRSSDTPRVSKQLIERLRQISQIAGELNLKLIVTLFDFDDSFAPAGTRDSEHELQYLHDIVGNFLGDDRILAWDIHNEPDHYAPWKHGNPAQTLDWLGRMADELHRLDRNHLVTVGMGSYETLYMPGPDGRTVLDYSDIISLHNYNADDLARQISEVRARTGKPIILGEFGWPTGPVCVVAEYTEAQQARVYQTALQAATGRVAGVFAWTLRDFEPGPTKRLDTREEHYGLYRTDGSLKPAASSFVAYNALPLPSALRTQELIKADELDYIDGPESPRLIAESGHYIKGKFRRAWDLFGGRASLGLPLNEAYPRPGDGVVVQHFEHAVLEFHPEAAEMPDFGLLTEADQIALFVRPQALGWGYAQSQQLEPGESKVAQRFRPFYDQFRGSWRLGKAISDERSEIINAQLTYVQYFENGRLEWNETKGWAESTALGKQVFHGQCRAIGQ